MLGRANEPYPAKPSLRWLKIHRIIPLTKQRANVSFILIILLLLLLLLLLLVHWFGNWVVWGSQQVIMEHDLGDAFDPI